MFQRFTVAALLLLLTGCTWEGRPDGGSATHTDEGADPLSRMYDESDPVEPLDGTGTAAAPDAMPLAPSAPAPAGAADAAAMSAGSATGDGAATGRGAAMPGTTGNPTP